MLPSKRRLNLKKDFRWTASGSRLGNSLVNIFFRYGDNNEPRVGIAVPKASFKKATERNRARRLISKGFENLYSRLPRKINIVAMPKKEILNSDAEEITRLLEELLVRVRKNEKVNY